MNTAELARSLDGDILLPADPGFRAARTLWNARFDRSPDIIARCATLDDVRTSIDFAREQGVPLSVKGGGHSYAANSVRPGGILIDLGMLDDVRVSPADRTASVGGGTTCAQLDSASQVYGLATPLPTVSSVGVVGAALGGGGGYLSRKYGLTLDNIVSAEVVTAEGDCITASRDEHPDLFWALRGGGGNFGIVTRLELRLHEVGPQVLAGQIIYPFDDAAAHLRRFRDFMGEAPDELQCYPFCFLVPPIDAFPAEMHGKPVLDFVYCHQNPAALEEIQPLRMLGTPVADLTGVSAYVETQTTFDPNMPKGNRYTSKAHDLARLSDGAIDTMVEFVPQTAGAMTASYFDPFGGAIGRVDPTATAYAGRQAQYGFHVIAGWADPGDDDAVLTWADEFQRSMSEHATGGVYVNLIADDEADRIPSAYGPNYQRLGDLKSEWDPDNLFSSNYNIPPR
jgi:FAD/FMN-containing dehydrogenase